MLTGLKIDISKREGSSSTGDKDFKYRSKFHSKYRFTVQVIKIILLEPSVDPHKPVDGTDTKE